MKLVRAIAICLLIIAAVIMWHQRHHRPVQGTVDLSSTAETPQSKTERIYNSLFPYWAEVCAGSEYAKRSGKFDKGKKEIILKGGNGGHAVMFIHGACMNSEAAIPQLKLCEKDSDATNPDSGVGISVDKIFKNINWMGSSGRNLFFNGGLRDDEVLTPQRYEKLVADLAKNPALSKVAIEDELLSRFNTQYKLTLSELKLPSHRSQYQEIIVREMIGTDVGLSLARSLLCTRLPLPQAALQDMINWLNERNLEAFKYGYHWDGVLDNCSHTTSNAFAATGVYDFKDTDRASDNALVNLGKISSFVLQSGFKAILHEMPGISAPTNNVIRLAEAAFERKIGSAADTFGNKDHYQTMAKHRWISYQPGAMMAVINIRLPAVNQIYVQGKEAFIFKAPPIKPQRKKLERYRDLDHKIYFDLQSNLEFFIKEYRDALAKQKSVDEEYNEYVAKHGNCTPDAYKPCIHTKSEQKFFQYYYRAYYQWLEETLTAAEEGLELLR